MPNYHVVKNRDTGDWAVKKAGASRVSGNFSTQREAEKSAKIFAENNGGGEVRIHGLDGKIRDSDTVPPGKDSCPPKDRRY
ncbi:MAG: DUF2188 domain-containing protein [Patescibacteria group bacterium]|nr:DUF2188 domain-containing protein [Patescibacteria group bacterium]